MLRNEPQFVNDQEDETFLKSQTSSNGIKILEDNPKR